MLSIITVINKWDVFCKGLQASLDLQIDVEYEVIAIDNTESKYSSMASALNEGIDKAQGDWILFCHPDIEFRQNHELSNIMDTVEILDKKNDNIGLYGAAGVEDSQTKKFISTIVHGKEKSQIPNSEAPNGEFASVFTVDACFFIIKKSIISEYKFDETIKGFHFHTEELCFRLRKNGYKLAVISMKLWHYSSGASLDYTYYKAARKVMRKYKNERLVLTTSFRWKNNVFSRTKLYIYQARNYAHHKLVRQDKKVGKG